MVQGLRCLLVVTLLATAIVVTPSVAQAATLTVTNTADAGAGSLRQAIDDAAAGDTIDFAIPGAEPHTITLTSGALTIDKDLTIEGPGAEVLAISGNNSSRVFEISAGVTVVINGLAITGGSTAPDGGIASAGGGIGNRGTLTITGSIISGNASGSIGGGIFNASTGTLNLTSTIFAGNTATSRGGGFDNAGTLTITSSTLSGNSARFGGGISNTGTGTLAVTGSTLSGNSAQFGGGILNTATLTVTGSTISGNSATSRGGGIDNASILTITSTIVAGNSASVGSPDVYGSVSSGTHNLIGVTPLLGSLQDNGGPTQTLLPEPGSPAIDAIPADHALCTGTDQRGAPRPSGSGCDIGAVEVQRVSLTVPAGITEPATSSDGTTVSFEVTTTPTTDWRGNPVIVVCDPASGSPFPLGETTVTCATSGAADHDVEDSFTVTLVLPEPPTLALPDDLTVPATSPAGATVSYAASATNAGGQPLEVSCEPPSGAVFPVGVTTVECAASDGFDQTTEGSFSVTVLGGSQQLAMLIQDTRSAPVSILVKPRLLVLLAAADLSLRRGQTSQACTALTGYATTVQLFSAARLIPADVAADLRADAMTIRGALGCR